mmetsp:Transcript_42655/g.101297  ORF Transcript_42655/g.101297 Transcript_42655/m.101297 type:complete len:229 (+) Transcript_42655:1074-1760(+)
MLMGISFPLECARRCSRNLKDSVWTKPSNIRIRSRRCVNRGSANLALFALRIERNDSCSWSSAWPSSAAIASWRAELTTLSPAAPLETSLTTSVGIPRRSHSGAKTSVAAPCHWWQSTRSSEHPCTTSFSQACLSSRGVPANRSTTNSAPSALKVLPEWRSSAPMRILPSTIEVEWKSRQSRSSSVRTNRALSSSSSNSQSSLSSSLLSTSSSGLFSPSSSFPACASS